MSRKKRKKTSVLKKGVLGATTAALVMGVGSTLLKQATSQIWPNVPGVTQPIPF